MVPPSKDLSSFFISSHLNKNNKNINSLKNNIQEYLMRNGDEDNEDRGDVGNDANKPEDFQKQDDLSNQNPLQVIELIIERLINEFQKRIMTLEGLINI